MVVFHGGSAVGTTLTNAALESVSSGGTAISTTVSSGSYLWVSSGGTASFVTVSSGGTADVYAGGSARFATVDDGGTEIVSGTAISTTVNSGGFEDVSSGGRTSFAAVDSGGTENVFAGGTAISATVNSSGTAFVYPGGTTSFATVESGASEYVYKGGRTISTTVKSGGTEFVFPGGTASFTTVSSGGALDEPAASGSGGLVIDVSYDSTVESAPSGFKTTVAAAVDYLESLISTPITITIDVGFGKVGGTSLGSGNLGESESSGIDVSYQTLRSALLTHAAATGDYAAAASLPASDPTDGGTFYVSYAEAEALGLSSGPGAGGTVGAIGLSSSLAFTYGTTDAVTSDTYDAFGVVEHEITEVMGRTEDLGELGTGFYTPLDLFRYASPGVRDLTPASGWFSVDGTDLLAQFNDPSNGGDAGDWAASVPNDSFDAFSLEGAVNPVSPTDLQVMDAIGYTPTVIEPAANTTATWLGAVSADWNTASDWNIGVAPDAGTIDVLISQPGIYVVSIAAGESFTVGAVTLANTSNASGALAISGTGTGLTALGGMEVGAGGAGSLLIENRATAVTGGNMIALGFDVGTEAGASGAVTVTGTHSLLLNTGGFIVGDAGLGSLSIEDGAVASTALGSAGGPAAAIIAAQNGAAGSSVNVVGAGSDWRITGTLVVGNAAEGALDIASGATFTAASLVAAAQSGGDGVITVAGTGSELAVTGSLTLGAQAAGELSILSGATASALDLTIGGSPALSSGNVDVEGAGSELSIATGGALNIGVASGGGGVLTIGSDAVLNFAGIPTEYGHASFNNYGTVDPDGFEYTTASNGNAGLNLYDLYIGNIGAVQVSAGTSTWFTPMVLTGTSVADAANNIDNNGDVGEWQLSNDGTLVFNANTVDAGQAIVFEDATDTLVIGQHGERRRPGDQRRDADGGGGGDEPAGGGRVCRGALGLSGGRPDPVRQPGGERRQHRRRQHAGAVRRRGHAAGRADVLQQGRHAAAGDQRDGCRGGADGVLCRRDADADRARRGRGGGDRGGRAGAGAAGGCGRWAGGRAGGDGRRAGGGDLGRAARGRLRAASAAAEGVAGAGGGRGVRAGAAASAICGCRRIMRCLSRRCSFR